jgi:hypothetical protein
MTMPDAEAQPGSTTALTDTPHLTDTLHLTDTTALLAELLALESAAMDRWGAGDPDGFLELSADDVTYIDPWQATWVVGLPALTEVYDGIRGQVHIDSYEFVEPAVVASGDLAVLSFRFESTTGGAVTRWNTTEVYRRDPGRSEAHAHADADAGPGVPAAWRLVHTHWSLTDVGARLTSSPTD